MVCCDLTLVGSLFHSTGAAVAKCHLAFLGQNVKTDNLLPHVRLLDLISGDKQAGCEKVMALKIRRLYFKKVMVWGFPK